MFVGASDEDDLPRQGRLEVQGPAAWKRQTCGGCQVAGDRAIARGGNKAARAVLEVGQRAVVESTPDFLLPAPIEILGGVLQAGFSRWCEHGDDAEAQTQPHDAPEGIAMLMRALEAIVIVELGVGRQADFPPVPFNQGQDLCGCEGRTGPGSWDVAVNRGRGQDFDFGAVGQVERFDDVETVQFGVALAHGR